MADDIDAGSQEALISRKVEAQPLGLHNQRDVRIQGRVVGGFTVLYDDSQVFVQPGEPP